MRIKLSLFLLCLFCLVGCLRKEYTEKVQALTLPDGESLTVGAEVLGQDNVFDPVVEAPLTVRANRSWSAVIAYDGEESDWLTLSEEESLNLQEFSQDEVITVKARRNKTVQSRSARITISEDADNKITIPVIQEGQTRFLSAVPNREKALSIQDTIKLSVACNTLWKAEVEPSSTAAVKLLLTGDEATESVEGEDYQTVKVCFDENNDGEHELQASVKLTAEGCDPFVVNLVQGKGEPYVAFKTDDNTTIPTEEYAYPVHFAANVHWHMAVAEATNFPEAKLSVDGGEPASTVEGEANTYGTVILTHKHGTDPGVQKSIKLKIWADGVEPVFVTLKQYGCLHLDFMDFDIKWNSPDHPKWWYTAKWPFATPAYSEVPKGSAASWKDQVKDFTTAEGYVFKMSTSGATGIWFHEHQMGFIIGPNKNDTWVQFPAIEGLRLTKVIFEPPYTAGAYTTGIRDVNGNAVKGGDPWKSEKCSGNNQVSKEMEYNHTWELPETEVNTPYRHVLIYTGSINYKDLILIYE